MKLPKGLPRTIEAHLSKSFALFWVDTSAAANAMRTSLEALLDELNVPSSRKNAKGKTVSVSLSARLDMWSAQEKDYADLCHALRQVGNLGSHDGKVRDEHYFDALEIYAHVLSELFENNSKMIKELAKKLKSEIKGP